MKVDAKLLWEAIKNATLFSKAKGFAGGVTRLVANLQSQQLQVSTSDDYIGISTWIPYEGSATGSLFLDHKRLKDLETVLRTQEGEVELNLSGASLHVDPLVASCDISDNPNPEWWGMYDDILSSAIRDRGGLVVSSWEVSPARLQKLSLLEPKGEYPISWKNTEVSGRHVVALKYGPRTRLVLMPLDRGALEDAYPDTIGDVVW